MCVFVCECVCVRACVCVCVHASCMCTSMLKDSLGQGVFPLRRTHFGPLLPGCVNCSREMGTACNIESVISQVTGIHASMCVCMYV